LTSYLGESGPPSGLPTGWYPPNRISGVERMERNVGDGRVLLPAVERTARHQPGTAYSIRARTGNVVSAVFARGVRPFLNRLTTPQDPTQSFLTARSPGNFSGLARTPKIPGLCHGSRRRESPPDARIGSRLVPDVGVRSPGSRPGLAPGAAPDVRRLREAAPDWPRRIARRDGPCSVSPAAPATSPQSCPAA